MGMRVLVDTNVILDYLLKREPYEENARKIIFACKQGKIMACIAAHSVSNIFFILRKEYTVEERRGILKDICKLFEVEGINKSQLLSALDNLNFKDFEDCLQMECAKEFRADYIVSRNINDFRSSEVPCITPEEMCCQLGNV